MTWDEVCDDPTLEDLPYKIELNKWGNIEMSPAKSYHGEYQGEIAHLLRSLKPDGAASTECAIDTAENVKVADVAWISYVRRRSIPRASFYATAPEICVEISPQSNSPGELAHKGPLYLQAGAQEFWICDPMGEMRFFDAAGSLVRSRLCPDFPLRVVIPD